MPTKKLKKKKKSKDDLSPRWLNFIDLYQKSGNAKQAAIQAGFSEEYANVITTRFPEKVRKSLTEIFEEKGITEELLAQKHKSLFDQKEVSFFVFPKYMEDEEIINHVAAAGFETIVVRDSLKGKLAFYSIDNARAIKDGLDLAYKIKGSFAPEKKATLNIDLRAVLDQPKLKEINDRYTQELYEALKENE